MIFPPPPAAAVSGDAIVPPPLDGTGGGDGGGGGGADHPPSLAGGVLRPDPAPLKHADLCPSAHLVFERRSMLAPIVGVRETVAEAEADEGGGIIIASSSFSGPSRSAYPPPSSSSLLKYSSRSMLSEAALDLRPTPLAPQPPPLVSFGEDGSEVGDLECPLDDGPPQATNVVWHQNQVSRQEREAAAGHRSCTIWLTGLSGSGKSTIAVDLERALANRGVRSYVLDGDNVRHGLNSNLGFTCADRQENIRRVGEVAKLFTDAGTIVICAFISPYREDRRRARSILDPGDFIEVHVACTVEECERRDVKGLYKKAREGLIPHFTGVSPDAPFEIPERPEIVVDTARSSLGGCTQTVIDYLETEGILEEGGFL